MPGIGDVPILGQLFRSKSLNHSTMELIVVVTPTLVDPLNNNIPVPPNPTWVQASWRPGRLQHELPRSYGQKTHTTLSALSDGAGGAGRELKCSRSYGRPGRDCALSPSASITTRRRRCDRPRSTDGLFVGELQDYSLHVGEVHTLLKIQNAEHAVCVIDFDNDRNLAVQAANSIRQMLQDAAP